MLFFFAFLFFFFFPTNFGKMVYPKEKIFQRNDSDEEYVHLGSGNDFIPERLEVFEILAHCIF